LSSHEVRWLTEEEQAAWQAYVAMRDLLEDQLDRQLRRDAGMTHMSYGLLVFLSAADGQCLRMTELARKAKITRPRLTYAVNTMEAKGWVRREAASDDRRGQSVILTEVGREVMRRTAPGHVSAVRTAVFARLTAEQVTQFGQICAIIAEGLEPESGTDLPWQR
jgi:DNA-binding MarR family transcriptional regulator